jgi:hypothetical protein
LYGYKDLSDGAKLTYQVIDGFDWESKDTGDSKGYVFPAIETIAKIRNTSPRTIQRHIKELEGVRLLARQRRKYKSSVLFIEDISDKEGDEYLKEFVDKSKERKETRTSRNDKNVDSTTHRETTKMSVPYIKEDEVLKENKINVNEDFKSSRQKREGELSSIQDILLRYRLTVPVKEKRPENYLKRDYYADQIANELDDHRSLGCFRVIAEKVPQTVIFEVLGSVKETALNGKIRKSRGALFVDIIKQYAQSKNIILGF